jgi:hypothetical protein
LVAPNTPSDTNDPVGESDGGDIVAASFGGADGPGLELVWFLDAVSGEESGTGTVNEEHACVGIAALGDAAYATAEA